MNQKKQNVSMSVIRRLPRYYRFLTELRKKGETRISSRSCPKGWALQPLRSGRTLTASAALASRDME